MTLTFDNGPTPGVTEDVLDLLAARGLRAAFFVVGRQLARDGGRALARRAAGEGHWIGNHSMSHSVPLGETGDPDAPEREIGDVQDLLGELAHPDRLFRPFGSGGHLDRRLLSEAALAFLVRGRYTCVLWNSVPRDWEDPDGWVERALADVGRLDHTVIVLHDVATGAMRHLGPFLDGLAARGVEVVQDFPDDCVPVRRGVLTTPLDHLVAGRGLIT